MVARQFIDPDSSLAHYDQAVGRLLLHDVITYGAAEKFERIILNTQTETNGPSICIVYSISSLLVAQCQS